MPTTTLDITLYWRPGCGFCSGLMAELDTQQVPYTHVNIWDDPEGATFVRQANNGNELVPTLQVGEHVLSNPGVGQVLASVHAQDPDSDLPAPPEPGRLARGVNRILGGS